MNNLTRAFPLASIKSVEGEILENAYIVKVYFELRDDEPDLIAQFKEELEKKRKVWGGEQLKISDKSSKGLRIEEIGYDFFCHSGRMGFMSEIMVFGESLAHLEVGTVSVTTGTRPISNSLLLDKPREKPLPTPQLS